MTSISAPALARASLVLLVACASAAGTHAQPLGLPEAVRLAEQRALSTTAAESVARSAREMAVAAAQRPDPVLRFSLDNLPVDGPDRFSITRDFMTMRSVGVMQTFTREDKRKARAARFEREADAALADRALRAASLRRDTAIAWFERRNHEQRVALLRAQVDVAEQQVQAAEAALRGARGSQADWLIARDVVAQTKQSLLMAEAEQANARRSLARWTGTPADRPLADAPAVARPAWAAHPVADRLEHHPELLTRAAREAAAAAEAQAAREEREPDWSAELMFSQRGSRYSNMVSLAVSLPLPWDRPQRQDRELAARLAQVDALRAEREEAAREHAAETERWLEAWRSGLARLALIDTERAPLARQRVEAALASYRGGSIPLLQVLDARRAALALQLDRIDIELETSRLWARLEFLIPAHVEGVTR
jgi:cobalt-zinc-cadmium efflux system outer membrane protein